MTRVPSTKSKWLTRGTLIPRLSRSVRFRRKFVRQWKKVEKKKVEPKIPKVKQFGKDGKETRTVRKRTKHFYPADPIPHKLNRRFTPKTAALRKSITPGTVLILLSGKFMAKRVIFLRQLKSGLLLVTGPFVYNGVPIRRVNQAFVIATQTKLDISTVEIPDKFNDSYFIKEKLARKDRKVKTEDDFFATTQKKKAKDPQRLKDQDDFDVQLLPIIKKVPDMIRYLKSRFALRRGDCPHLMNF